MSKSIFKRCVSLLLSVLLFSSMFFGVSAVPNEETVEKAATGRAVTTANQNQMNMVARADYYYGITWVAQQTVAGWGGTFYQGNTYHIPYGQPIYSGKYVGYAASVEEFLKAASTAGSIFYTGRSYYEGTTAPYYVSDCSSFVSWVWGIDRTTTYYIPNKSTGLGYVTTDRATHTLQLGDALNNPAHVVLVSGLEYNSSGAITRIEITEQTPPQMKRSTYTPSQLASKYGNYTIQRYTGNVPTAPGQKQETWIEKAAFDVMVYRDRNKDLAGMTDAQLKEHWLNHGIKEGRPSSTVLDLGFYMNNNPDLKTAFGTDYAALYNHFITKGYKEHRKSSALFDGNYYCEKYPEVVASYKDEFLRHYVEVGIKEGRRASLTFDPDYYWHIVPDVYTTWPNDYTMCARHYAGHGINAQIEAYDHEHPVISNVSISNISSNGYTITCRVTDNWGLSQVAFPTWTLKNDQDDLAADFMNTQQGTKSGDTYTFQVKSSQHNYETGQYVTHIYAVDKGGNTVKLALDVVNVGSQSSGGQTGGGNQSGGGTQQNTGRITLSSASTCRMDQSFLKNVKANTTVSALLNQFENSNLQVLTKTGGTVTGSTAVGTGSVVNLYNGSSIVDSVTVVVMGDVDGNGNIDSTDYMRVKAAFLGNFSMNSAEVCAADVDANTNIDSTDYMRIKNHFLGMFNIYSW